MGRYQISNICVNGIPKGEERMEWKKYLKGPQPEVSKSNKRHQTKYSKSSEDTKKDKNKINYHQLDIPYSTY